ncbi:uncharacterized protein [Haliotis asinina]|uniref:uncharacterized protein n=1 Tax=Haliotis asinina TaxID=109174 RepID=UPI0035327CED
MSVKSRQEVISCEAVQYECGICLREFSTSWCLQMHIKTHSEQNSFDCHECGMIYPDFSALCEHLKVHIFGADPVEQDTEPPCISACHDPMSQTEGNQIRNTSKSHLICVTCDKSFGSLKALKLHSRIHRRKKVAQTEEPDNLSTGKTVRTTKYECNQGGIEKEDSQNVKTKRDRPNKNQNKPQAHFSKDGKKFRCEVCAIKLSSRSLMEKHILVHQTGHFHCSQCDRSFLTQSDLKDHENVHNTVENSPISHVLVVEDHVKAVELVVEEEKGFSCIVCGKTFNSKQKAHVHILCHKKRKGRYKLKMSKRQQSNSGSDTSLRRKDVSDFHANAGVGASHMTHGPENTSQSFCCGECKEQFGTQDELVHHQNLHIRDHTIALMRILKPGTNLDVSIAETQTLLNAVHSASDLVQTTIKETTFRNTSIQDKVSPAIQHPENSQPDKATESHPLKNLLKTFPNVQCNAKVVLERLENEALLVRNGGEKISRLSTKHENEGNKSVQQITSGKNGASDTNQGTGVGCKMKETVSNNDKVLREGGDYSDDGDNNTFHDEDDIDHIENTHYSVSVKGSNDLMTSEPAQDVVTAENEQEKMSAESPHKNVSAKHVNDSMLTQNSKGNTPKLSGVAKCILENVVEKGDMFSCRICEVEFTQLQKAKNHVRIHVSKKRFECKFCPAKFVYASKLLSHQAKHMSQNLSAEKKTRLTTRCHYEIAGNEFICKICNKSFITKRKVQGHVRYHLLEDTYQCRFCQKCFRKKYSLYVHEKTHPEAAAEEGSKSTSMDDRHVEDGELKEVKLKFKRGKYKEYIEPEDDILKCKLCASTFKNNKQIIDHFRSHFAERKFWCPICSAAFKRNTHLVVHMKAHDRGNIKMPSVRITEGVKESINTEKNKEVKMNQENKNKDGVELTVGVPIHTQGTKDQRDVGSGGLPGLPLGDTLVNVSVSANKGQQANVATLSQEDLSCSKIAGDETSSLEDNLRQSSCSCRPTSTTTEIVKCPSLNDADGASSSGEEGHLLTELPESTVTGKETFSYIKRELADNRSGVAVDFTDGDDDGEQKDMTQAVAAAVAACVKDGTESDPKAQIDPHSITAQVEMLPAASDDGGDDDGDDDGMIDADDVSDDNDSDSDFKYDPYMDCDSDISSEDVSPIRSGIPTVKYLYESPSDCHADEMEIEEPNINVSSGSKNQDGPSRNKQDTIQHKMCSPKNKKSKSSNKPNLKDKTASKERGRRVITQDSSVRMTQLVNQRENLRKEITKGQGQEGDTDLHHHDHEYENRECQVGSKTAKTGEECSLVETASSDSSLSSQMYQTEYTIEAGGSFRCAFCDKVFKSLLSIRNHLSVEHDLFRCKTCIAAFQTHQELMKHNEENKHLQLRVLSNRNIESKMEIVGGMFKCTLCLKTFLDKEKCALHVRHHLTAFKYICDICSQACKSRSVLAIHMSRHNNSCIYECKVCFKKYPNMGSMRFHEKSHSEEEKINILNYVKCETCGDLCFNRKMLEKHVLQHKDKHSCDFCKRSFSTHSGLVNHQSLEQHYKCKHCGKTYKDQKYLKKHIQCVHIQPDTHMCDKCGKTLSSLAGLRAHMVLHTGTSKFQCSICKLKFQHAGKLEHHMKAHEAGGGLCDLCNKFFRNKIGLNVHRMMHQALEAAGIDFGNPKGLLMREHSEYTCPCCKKTTGTVEQLQQHIKHHFLERRFKCTMCDMAFFTKYYLETHIRIHNKDFRFQCDQCPRKFASSNFLNNHIKKIHLKSDRGTFPCDICKKIFRTKEGVASHRKRLHKERVRNHPCDQCDMSFFSSSELKAHKPTHSTERAFMCDLCGMSYKTKYMLRDHMLRHEGRKDFKCDLCGKEFYLKAYLKIHLRNHKNERNFKCDICDKGFNHPNSLADHRRIHTGEKPYKCNFCDRKFTDRSARRTHQMSHKMSTKKKDNDDL